MHLFIFYISLDFVLIEIHELPSVHSMSNPYCINKKHINTIPKIETRLRYKKSLNQQAFCFCNIFFYSISFFFVRIRINSFSFFLSNPTEIVSPSVIEALIIISAISSSKYF